MATRPPIKILLADDSPTDCLLIEQRLGQLSQFPFALERVNRLSAALGRMSEGEIDVLLLDLNLPDSAGIETLVTARSQSADVPIVVLTGMADEPLGLTAIQHGAQDYLTKERIDGQSLARCLNFAIERKRVQATEQKLDVARSIQQRLFPSAAPALSGFDIAAACYPADVTSGDYYDYLCLADGSLGVVIADVSGHGFGPALLMAETRAYLRALARANTNVGEIVTTVNRILTEDTSTTEFITLFFARIDRRGPSFTYTGAGHNGFHFNAAGQVRELTSTEIPLAVNISTTYKHTQPYPLHPGDVLLLLTDGVPETAAADGSQFGIRRAQDVVRHTRDRSAQDIVADLYQATRDFSGGRAQDDDITTVVIKVMAP